MMVTAALPVYGATESGGKALVGVVGVDVLTAALAESFYDTD